jgi:hypothetical protein
VEHVSRLPEFRGPDCPYQHATCHTIFACGPKRRRARRRICGQFAQRGRPRTTILSTRRPRRISAESTLTHSARPLNKVRRTSV